MSPSRRWYRKQPDTIFAIHGVPSIWGPGTEGATMERWDVGDDGYLLLRRALPLFDSVADAAREAAVSRCADHECVT